jgi:signal transduction histidine kinase
MQAHALQVIARNAAAQSRLVDDLLDLSMAVAGHLRIALAEVDVCGVVRASVEALRPAAEDAGVRLVHAPDRGVGQMRADPVRLQQIVTNLLSNAIKFTPAGGTVTVAAAREAGAVVLTVEDTGIGITPAFLPHVFERFRQEDSSSTRPHAGAGLGLTITEHLVRLHGGTIAVDSAGPGKGSRFTVRLPAVDDATRVALSGQTLHAGG